MSALPTGALVYNPATNGLTQGTAQGNTPFYTPSATPGQPGYLPTQTGTSTVTTPVSQATIAAILQSITNQVQTNQNAYNSAASSNATNDAQAAIDHGNQVQGNTTSRATAVQNAEQAAAQGNQGLKAILASLGALNGTGQVLAGRAVANSANSDIGGADQTFQNNATAIENANNVYQNSAHERDAALRTALDNDNKSAQSTGIQSILNDAQNAGDIPTYQKFLPQLVQATAPAQAILPSTTTFNPATVNSFAPTSKLNVSTAPVQAATTPVNSALYVKKQS